MRRHLKNRQHRN